MAIYDIRSDAIFVFQSKSVKNWHFSCFSSLGCGHLFQNVNDEKKPGTRQYIRTKESKNYSKLMMFILGPHNRIIYDNPV